MAAFKVEVVKRKLLGQLDVQLPVKDRLVTVACTTMFILLLAAFSLLAYCLSVMLIANKGQVPLGGDTQSYATDEGCGYFRFVPKNRSSYVQYPEPSSPNGIGNRCAFTIFSKTKETRISYANYSFHPSSNAGVIVAELDVEEGNKLKYLKLDYSGDLIARSPFVIYYTSEMDGVDTLSSFVIEVSPIESSGPSTAGSSGSLAMWPYTTSDAFNNTYPDSPSYPMDFLAVFEAPHTSQPDRHFTCSPRNSTCCNAISLYQLPTFKLGGIASRLTGLKTGGVKVRSEVTVVMMYCLPGNFDASAIGSTCLFEWHAVNKTTKEIALDY